MKLVKVLDDLYFLLKKVYEYSKDFCGGFDMVIGLIIFMWYIGFDDVCKLS